MAARHPAFGRAVLLGYGGVGRLLRALVGEHVESLTVVDAQPARDDAPHVHLVADVTAPIDEQLAGALNAAELIMCALPEDALVAALPGVIAAASPRAVLVDTASVKSPLPPLWDADGPAVLSINPMFAPSLSPTGRSVLAVAAGRSGRQQDFVTVLRHNGMVVTLLDSADEHDRLVAVTQAAVHAATLAYGLTLAGAGFAGEEVARLAPPPCRQQLMLLARMVGQPAEVYEDIQRSNPHAAAMRAEVVANLSHIGHLASEKRLGTAITDIANWLGAARVPLAQLCQDVFDNLTGTNVAPER